MKTPLLITLITLTALPFSSRAADLLERGFAQPPESTKPWCYWYWITDNISRQGITKDLEAMKRVGISQAFIGNIYLDEVKHGTVKALTEEWWGMVEHAIREGGRLGVDVGLFNCPGWSQSGGPWIKPDQAMRYVVSTERRVKGPLRFAEKLIPPSEPFQDIAVLAFPAPEHDADTIAARSPRVTCAPEAAGAGQLADGDRKTTVMFPKGAGQGKTPFTVDLEVTEPFTARSLVLWPAERAFAAQCELQAAAEDGVFRTVREFPLDRSNTNVHVGPIQCGPVAVAFPAQTAKRFRLVITGLRNNGGLAEIELSGAARLERFVEKQLGKMHPTPLPTWDTYLWPKTAEPDSPALAVPPGTVLNLSDRLAADGTLTWEVPAGEWIILRTGMTPTGTRNAPASPEGQGLEVDKMNRAAAQAHFDAYVGKLLQRLPKADRKAFTYVIADSYEMGSQNWTDGFGGLFRERYGYDPHPWLPVLTGRLIGSADQSDRFLWDLRRLVADRVAYDYVGGLRDACHRHGLKLWLENYGHWGYPAEFLQYGGQADEVSGEFWATGDLGSIELRCASSAAHTYGKPIVHAEAFTSGVLFESTPWSLKRRGDWALTEGINHWVLHVYIHQPWDDRRPGVNAWFSTEFNRHNTWFEQGREWIDYYRRCDFLLQQGHHVADVAYFIGEDTPKMTGTRKPALPPGYNFDYINAEVIEQRLKVKDGRFVLPDGMSYRVLVLPGLDTMRPELLAKIRDLVKAGGIILGPPPSRSPSLKDYPQCDVRVKQLAAELWGQQAQGSAGPSARNTQHAIGKGRVLQSTELQPVLDELGIPPDFSGADPKHVLWTHRSSKEGEIYFICNQAEQAAAIAPVFRVSGKLPELWDAVSGRIVKAAAFAPAEGGTRVPLELGPRGSLFVVFREPAGKTPAVTAVTRDGGVILSTAAKAAEAASGTETRDAVNNFTMTGWLKPAAEIALPAQTNSGVFMNAARNDAVFPSHGASAFSDVTHACAGISAGRNGVCVYEHSSDYFAPLLAHRAPLTNWTHIAVVYQDGTPSLYLNGTLAHRGVRSRFNVHSGLSVEPSGGGNFKGELSGLRDFGRPLGAAEVAELAKAKPAAGSALPAIIVARAGKGSFEAEVTASGSYAVNFSNGQSRTLEVPALPPPLEITGPWEVRFPAQMDVPERGTLDRLISLTEHTNEAIRYFSGTAAYARSFDLPAGRLAGGQRLLLDLGRVEALAEVSLNGKNLGVLWKPPFVLDVTDAARLGRNSLEVRVTGTWRNRLIGDAKHPAGFPSAERTAGGPAQFKPYLGVALNLRADEPPAPFGLMGPVQLRNTRRITFSP
ncbi:MAG TPA: glycosyl hydrolase [Verrucomicrobiota bacterium]|nr:glycosyl hydrolase [Verrucomicrobiota bacterium]